jgi:hypothetical protein
VETAVSDALAVAVARGAWIGTAIKLQAMSVNTNTIKKIYR